MANVRIAACCRAWAAGMAMMAALAGAWAQSSSLPPGTTPNWIARPAAAPTVAAPPVRLSSALADKLYRDTSLTACPAGEKLQYFYHWQWDTPFPETSPPEGVRAASWCGAAQADLDWANLYDPQTWRRPYLLESCTPGVSWSYSHALQNGTRYMSPLTRYINLVCKPLPYTIGLSAGPGTLYPKETARLLITVKDETGRPAAGAPVSIAQRGAAGTLVGCVGTTDPAGTLACDYRAGAVGKPILVASCERCEIPAIVSLTVLPPLDDANAKGPTASTCDRAFGNPVNAATAEKTQTERDHAGFGPHPLAFTRTYRSGRAASSASAEEPLPVNASLGTGWSHNLAISLVLEGDSARIDAGDGTGAAFTRQGAAWTPLTGADQLAPDPAGGMRYTRAADGEIWRFDAAGKLLTQTRPNGWVMSWSYVGNRVYKVRNQYGRTVSLYYAQGRLSYITFPDGQTLGLSYDAQGRPAQALYTLGRTRQYHYEDPALPWALTGLIDENGQRLATYAYDAEGRAVRTERAGGAQAYRFDYRADGTTLVTDPLGTPRTLRYEGARGSIAATQAEQPAAYGAPVQIRTLRADGLIQSETDFRGATTTYEWDAARRLPTQVTEAVGRPEARTTRTQWHPQWDLPVRTEEAGRTTEHQYDAQGQRIAETITDTATGARRTRRTTWTGGLPTEDTDPLGAVTRTTYDAQGLPTRIVNPLGHTTQLAYDAQGRLVLLTAPHGATTAYEYDGANRLVLRRTTPAGGTAAAQETDRFAYTPSGQLREASLASGLVLSYGYDAAQRLTHVQDNHGNTTEYALDGLGNRIHTRVRDALGNTSYAQGLAIDALNRVAALTAGGRLQWQAGHDENGRLAVRTEGEGPATSRASTAYGRDALGRETAQTFADGASATLQYDPLDQLVGATDPQGVRTRYGVDALGNTRAEESRDTGASSAQYDAAGNPTQRTDALGQTTRYSWDAGGRLTAIRYADGRSAAYDGAANGIGQLTRLEDEAGTTEYSYDGFGRLLTKRQTLKNGSTHTVRYAWAPGGLLASITYPSGRTVAYARDKGRVTAVTVSGQPFITGLAYDGLGQPTAWRWASGDAAKRDYDEGARLRESEIASYRWNDDSRIRRIEQKLHLPTGSQTSAPGTVRHDIDYDNRGRIAQMTHEPLGLGHTGTGNNNLQAMTVYTVDANPTGAQARFSETERFEYDANGNRTRRVQQLRQILPVTGAPGQSLESERSYRITAGSNRSEGYGQVLTVRDARGAVTSRTTLEVAQPTDAAGQHTGDALTAYGWDAGGRLAKVTFGASDARQSVVYLHNGLGQRVFKSEPFADAAPTSAVMGQGWIDWLRSRFGWMFGAQTASAASRLGTAFVYAEGHELLGEYGNGGASSTGSTEYIWLPTEQGNVLIGAVMGSETFAIHADHLNTPRLMTDAKNQPVWQWPFSAFGDNEPQVQGRNFKDRRWAVATGQKVDEGEVLAGRKLVKLDLRYTGQRDDVESGLRDNGFRSYDPRTGRYTQPDPLGLAAGWNRVPYAGNNPLLMVDPWGLDFVVAGRGVANLYADSGDLRASYNYTSGLGGATDPSERNKGPLPPGRYTLDPKEISEGGFFRSLLGDWGKYRAPLKPVVGTNTYGRDGFFMHGGAKPGSKGCIDLGSGDEDFFSRVRGLKDPVDVFMGPQ